MEKPNTSGKVSILAVDDDPFITNLLSKFVGKLGHDIHTLNSGLKIGEAMLTAKPDIIFLDLVMPDLDGVEIVEQLAKIQSRAHIVLMSGLSERKVNSVRNLVQSAGLNYLGVLTKPLSFDSVREIIATYDQSHKSAQPDSSLTNSKHGPAKQFHPEVWLTDQAGDFSPHVYVDTIWIGDDNTHHHLKSCLPSEIWANMSKGLLQLLVDSYCNGLKEVGQDVSGQYPRAKYQLPVEALDDHNLPEYLIELISLSKLKPDCLFLEFDFDGIRQLTRNQLDTLNRLSIKGFGLGIFVNSVQDNVLTEIKDMPFDELVFDIQCLDKNATLIDVPGSEIEFTIGSMAAYVRKQGMILTAAGVHTEKHLSHARKFNFHKARGPLIGYETRFKNAIEYCSKPRR